MQVIAWRTISEMTCNMSSGTLNLTHSLTHSLIVTFVLFSGEYNSELHAAGIPSLLTSLVTELTAQNIDSVQVGCTEYCTCNSTFASGFFHYFEFVHVVRCC